MPGHDRGFDLRHPLAQCLQLRRETPECLPRLRAAVAIAYKILVAAYHMLATGAPFHDLGEAYLDQQAHRRTTANLVRRLNSLGYDVMLQPRASA